MAHGVSEYTVEYTDWRNTWQTHIHDHDMYTIIC